MKTYPFGVIFRCISLTQLYLQQSHEMVLPNLFLFHPDMAVRDSKESFAAKKTGCSEHGNENLFSLIHKRKYIHVKSNQTR